MEKVIIYGEELLAEKAYNYLKDKFEIVSFTNKTEEKELLGCKVISVENLKDAEYDFIFVADRYRTDIEVELIELGVKKEKILGVPPDVLSGDFDKYDDYGDFLKIVKKERESKKEIEHFFHNPIFISGTHRCGTTALINGLGQHPNLLQTGEINWSFYFFQAVNELHFDKQGKLILGSLQRRKKMFKLYGELSRSLFESAFGECYGYESWIGRKENGRPLPFVSWVAKAKMLESTYQAIKTLYPFAKFVFILRNGIDAVHSHVNRSKNWTFKECCEEWATNVLEGILPLQNQPGCLLVRHEALVSDPKRFWQEVLSFLGLEYSEKPYEYTRDVLVISSFDKENNNEAVPKTEIFKNRVSPWEKWSDEEKNIFSSICKEAMEKAGYKIPECSNAA